MNGSKTIAYPGYGFLLIQTDEDFTKASPKNIKTDEYLEGDKWVLPRGCNRSDCSICRKFNKNLVYRRRVEPEPGYQILREDECPRIGDRVFRLVDGWIDQEFDCVLGAGLASTTNRRAFARKIETATPGVMHLHELTKENEALKAAIKRQNLRLEGQREAIVEYQKTIRVIGDLACMPANVHTRGSVEAGVHSLKQCHSTQVESIKTLQKREDELKAEIARLKKVLDNVEDGAGRELAQVMAERDELKRRLEGANHNENAAREDAHRLALTVKNLTAQRDETRAEGIFWQEEAARYSKGAAYYSGLLDEVANILGADAFVSDDGSVQDSPVRAKIPELVAKLRNERDKAVLQINPLADRSWTTQDYERVRAERDNLREAILDIGETVHGDAATNTSPSAVHHAVQKLVEERDAYKKKFEQLAIKTVFPLVVVSPNGCVSVVNSTGGGYWENALGENHGLNSQPGDKWVTKEEADARLVRIHNDLQARNERQYDIITSLFQILPSYPDVESINVAERAARFKQHYEEIEAERNSLERTGEAHRKAIDCLAEDLKKLDNILPVYPSVMTLEMRARTAVDELHNYKREAVQGIPKRDNKIDALKTEVSGLKGEIVRIQRIIDVLYQQGSEFGRAVVKFYGKRHNVEILQ